MRQIGRLAAAVLLAGAASFALGAHPAAAQDRTGTVEISPYGGGYFGGRLDAGTNAIFPADVDIADTGMWGVRLAFNTSRWFAVEAGFSQARADIRSQGSTVLWASNQKLGTMEVRNYDMNAVFNFGRRHVIGYFTIGGGASSLDADVPGVDSSSDLRFVGNIGGGVKLFVNPHFGFRFDGRWRETYLSHADCDYHSSHCDGYDDHHHDDNGGWYGSGELTAGITVAF